MAPIQWCTRKSTRTTCRPRPIARPIVEGVNIARRIARHAPLTSKIAEEFRPDRSLEMDDYRRHARLGTQQQRLNLSPDRDMQNGRSGADAVTDANLKVHGIGRAPRRGLLDHA